MRALVCIKTFPLLETAQLLFEFPRRVWFCLVCQSRMWTSQEKGSRGMGILSQKTEELYSVQMSISQAPSSFRQPVTQKKAFNPPFKVGPWSLVLSVINCRVNRCKYQPVWEMLDLKFL